MDIIGNLNVWNKLQKEIQEKKFSNVVIFSGIDGIGKAFFAKKLTPFLMYPNGCLKENEKRIENFSHPDFYYCRPDEKSDLHSIASIRHLIEQIYLEPFEAFSKVLIIDECEKMLPTSSNALLKTLEEPSLDSYIFLITSKLSSLLPTIISRSRVYSFSPIDEKETIPFLIKKGIEESKAFKIARLSGGSLKAALSFLEKDYDKILDCIMHKQDYFSFQDKLENISLDQAAFYLLMWASDLLSIQQSHERSLFFPEYRAILKNEVDKGFLPIEEIEDAIQAARLGLERNIKEKNCLEYLFFRIHRI